MKTIKMLSAACAVVFAFAALSASAAVAHEWKMEGKALTKSVSAQQTPTYSFADRTNGASFECKVEENGTVGTGGLGQITSVKEVSCKSISGFCEAAGGAPTIEAVKLPWSTELVTYEGGVGNRITSLQPEWTWKCRTRGMNWTETCGVATTLSVKNVGSGVEESYKNEKEDDVTSCSNSSGFSVLGAGVLSEPKADVPFQAF